MKIQNFQDLKSNDLTPTTSTMRFPCLLIAICSYAAVEAAKFGVGGPVLTLTLKNDALVSDHQELIDVSEFNPSLQWQVESLQQPFPILIPSLKAVNAGLGYSYNNLKRIPSFFECAARFATTAGELLVQPTYELKNDRATLTLKASRGPSSLTARLSNNKLLETVRASFLCDLPLVSLSSIRVTPTLNVPERDLACQLEATTGGLGRTKAILNLEYRNPTLSVVHSLKNHQIAPTINLYNARITYQWNASFGDSLLQTRVDPMDAIHLTWRDECSSGTWATDVRFPLSSAAKQESVSVRIRRLFRF
jgi:hypothetical protein